MKNILVHALKGYAVVCTPQKATFNRTLFKLGEEVSTIPNGLYAIADVLDRLVEIDDGEELYRIYTITPIADKLNNTSIFTREFLTQKVLSNKRDLLPAELETYERIINAMKVLYGRVLFVGETYIPTKNFADQEEASLPNMLKVSKEMIMKKLQPAPALNPVAVEASNIIEADNPAVEIAE